MPSVKISSHVEDYLEVIARIEKEKNVVRVKEISKALGVTYPSTSGILKRMEGIGLVEHERYGYVRLTPQGREIAEKMIGREAFLRRFLKDVLALTEEECGEDACRMEHGLGDETARRFQLFVDHLLSAEEVSARFLDAWRRQLPERKA